MAAGIHDFEIEQGANYTLTVNYETVQDLSSGYTSRFVMRKEIPPSIDDRKEAAILTATNDDIITLAATDPNITTAITAAQSALFDFATCTYELEITKTAGTVVTKVLRGTITLKKEVAYAD